MKSHKAETAKIDGVMVNVRVKSVMQQMNVAEALIGSITHPTLVSHMVTAPSPNLTQPGKNLPQEKKKSNISLQDSIHRK